MTRTRGFLYLTFTAAIIATLIAPAEARAQRRPGPRGSAVIVAAPYYYGPWWYDPWYSYPLGYPLDYQYPPFGYGYVRSASLRIQVEPRQTEVYIDGYYAGTVDDFDGFFQRLHARPGEHDVELYLQGYRTVRQQIYLQPGATFRLRYTMQPLQPGDTPEERPVPRTPPAAVAPPAPVPPPPAGRPQPRGRGAAGPAAESSFGSLVIQVQPPDAEILIDGEPWQSAGPARLVVQLPPGSHQVEIRKGGFETFRSSIQIRRGETTPLNVSLAQE